MRVLSGMNAQAVHRCVRHAGYDGMRPASSRSSPIRRPGTMILMQPTGMMMVTVQVRNFEALVAWYRDVLGLSVLSLEPDEFCALVPPGSDGPALALATDHPDRISPRPAIGWTPTLVVEDFDATVAELHQRGVAFDAQEEGADEGYRLVRVLDPEGNPIGITT